MMSRFLTGLLPSEKARSTSSTTTNNATTTSTTTLQQKNSSSSGNNNNNDVRERRSSTTIMNNQEEGSESNGNEANTRRTFAIPTARNILPFKRPEENLGKGVASSWNDIQDYFFTSGEYSFASKRRRMTCKFCGLSISPTVSTKANLMKHIKFTKDNGDNNNVIEFCRSLSNEADRKYISEIISKIDAAAAVAAIGNPSFTGGSNDNNHSPASASSSASIITNDSRAISAADNSRTRSISQYFMPAGLTADNAKLANLALVRWFATSAIPFNAIENRFARTFFQLLRPGYEPISRKSLGGDWLQTEYYAIQFEINMLIEKESAVNICIDGWSDIANKSIYATIVSFPRNGREYLYSIEDASGEAHTGDFVCRLLMEATNRIGREKVCAVISDDAANMRSGRRKFIETENYNHIFSVRCFMHGFSLVLESILKHRIAKDIIKCTQEIVTYFKAAHHPSHMIRNASYYFGKCRDKNTGLKSSNTTRMTSVQICCASVLNNKEVLKAVVNDFPEIVKNAEVKDYINDRSFWRNLEDLNALITPICECIMAIQGVRCCFELLRKFHNARDQPFHYFNSHFMGQMVSGKKKIYDYNNVTRWFKSLGLTAGQDIFSLKKVYIPINAGESHWSLAIISIEEKVIRYYDSLGWDGKRFSSMILRWIGDEHKNKKSAAEFNANQWSCINVKNIPQQPNFNACGAYMLAFATLLASNIELEGIDASLFDPEQLRLQIAIFILNKTNCVN